MSSEAATDDDSANLLERVQLRSLADVGTTQRQRSSLPEDPVDMATVTEHLVLENRPSTSSQVKMSPLRVLVRTLTPKRRPKPILVKAGFHRGEEATAGEDRDLHVTFDMPRLSTTSNDSVTNHSKPLQRLKMCCNRPLLPAAGILSVLGGMSFGYDLGIVSGMMQPVRDRFLLTCSQEQVLVGCLIGGALIVSICGGPWIDKCGRRRAILISSSVFVLGSGLCTIAPTLDTLSAGRLLQGFGMSLAAISECIYVSEIAPKDKRGLMVGLNELGITMGFVMAFVCGYALHGSPESWRILMAIGAGPAIIQVLGTFFFLPPSPREKMMNKFDKEAILILDNLRGSRNEAMNEFASIRHSLAVEDKYGTLSLFKSPDNMLYRLLVGFSLVFLHQLSGHPNVLFYATVVFEQFGFSARWASLSLLGLGVIKVTATAITLWLTDKRGRRFFLVAGCLLMAGSMLLVGISTLIRPPTVRSPCERNLTSSNAHLAFSGRQFHAAMLVAPPPPQPSLNDSIITPKSLDHALVAQLVINFMALVVYIVGYSVGFGPMTWLVLCELYPPGVKGRAVSFCNIISWTVNITLSLTFLQTLSVFTTGGTFLIFAVFNLFSAFYIFLVVPETEGKSLEKVSYDLRTVRPKQRFDANLLRLCPCLKSRLNRPSPGPGHTPVERRALL